MRAISEARGVTADTLMLRAGIPWRLIAQVNGRLELTRAAVFVVAVLIEYMEDEDE